MKRKLIIATTSVIALLILVLLFFQFTNRKNNQSPTDLVSQRSKSSRSQSKAEASSSQLSGQKSTNAVNNPDQAVQTLKAAINQLISYLYLPGLYRWDL